MWTAAIDMHANSCFLEPVYGYSDSHSCLCERTINPSQTGRYWITYPSNNPARHRATYHNAKPPPYEYKHVCEFRRNSGLSADRIYIRSCSREMTVSSWCDCDFHADALPLAWTRWPPTDHWPVWPPWPRDTTQIRRQTANVDVCWWRHVWVGFKRWIADRQSAIRQRRRFFNVFAACKVTRSSRTR